MKGFHLGLGLACLLAVLLWSALWGSARAASPRVPPPAEAGIHQAGLAITATIGLDPNTCGTAGTIQVTANTPVYYCYTVRNTGDVALSLHRVQTTRQGVITTSLPLVLPPGAITNTVRAGLRVADSADVDVTNVVTWTARTATTISPTQIITVNASTILDVVGPNLGLSKTVGQSRTNCSTTSNLRIPSGQGVFFCITLENRGDITLTSHTLSDSQQGINGTFVYTLPPGARLQILPDTLSSLRLNGSLQRTPITALTTNVVNVTSRTTNNLSSARVATATVDVGSTTVIFTKTVSTSPVGCPGSTNVVAPAGARLYYCASVYNNGVVTLTHHHFVETYLSIDVKFDYILRPGERIDVTNDTLALFNEPIVFGPFEWRPLYGNVVGNTMFYTGTAPGGFQVTSSSTTSGAYPPTPTNTATRAPRPTSTWTPSPTFTPSSTPVPLPPTFTPIPTPTPTIPTPTPTRSYAISLLETPTPRTQPAGVPFAPNLQIPGFDPVAATATTAAGGFYMPPTSGIDPNTGLPISPGIDPNTGLPLSPGIDPNTGLPFTSAPAIDPNTGLPISPMFDPNTGLLLDPNTGWPIDPNTGLPMTPTPAIDPNTGLPISPAIDPNTGLPISPGIDPNTGLPFTPTPMIDPNTGLPVTTQIDPNTGLPIAPVIDPNTGLPVTPAIDPMTGLPIAPGFATSVLPTPTLPPAEFPLPGAEIPAAPGQEIATFTPTPVTGTPGVQVIVVTNTPVPPEEAALLPLDSRRPVVPPTPTATPDTLLFAAQTVDTIIAAAGWIWFLAGSLIFFVTAGVIAGLFFRQAESRRFDLHESYADEWQPDPTAAPASGRDPQPTEDEWPDHLP